MSIKSISLGNLNNIGESVAKARYAAGMRLKMEILYIQPDTSFKDILP